MEFIGHINRGGGTGMSLTWGKYEYAARVRGENTHKTCMWKA